MMKSLFFALLISAPLLLGMSSSFAYYRLDHQKFVHLKMEEKKAIVVEIMKVVSEMEGHYRYEKNTDKLKKFTQLFHKLQTLMIAEASADAATRSRESLVKFTDLLKEPNRCLYSGYISQLNTQGKCTHLVNLAKASPERKAYQGGCKEPSQISCNPLIFGYKKIADSSPFCVSAGPSNDNAHNASVRCMQKALASPNEGDSADKRLAFLAQELSKDKALAKELFDFISKACVCDPGPKNLNTSYHKYMLPHRTCYGLMKMISTVTTSCPQPIVDDNTLKIFQDLQTKIQSDPAVAPSTFDSQYSGFLIDIGETQEFKGLCGVQGNQVGSGNQTQDDTDKSGSNSNGSNTPNNGNQSGKLEAINNGTKTDSTAVVTNDAISDGSKNTSSTVKPVITDNNSSGTTTGNSGGGSPTVKTEGLSNGSNTSTTTDAIAGGTTENGSNNGSTTADTTGGNKPESTTGTGGSGTPGGLTVSDSKPKPTDTSSQNPTNSSQNGGNNPTNGTTNGNTNPTNTQSDKPADNKPAETKDSTSQFVIVALEAKETDKTVDIKATSSPLAPADVKLVWYIRNTNTTTVDAPKQLEDAKPAVGEVAVDASLTAVKYDKEETNTKHYPELTGWKVQVTKTTIDYEVCAKLVKGETVVSNTACEKIDKSIAAVQAQENDPFSISVTIDNKNPKSSTLTVVVAPKDKKLPDNYSIYWYYNSTDKDPVTENFQIREVTVPDPSKPEDKEEEPQVTAEELSNKPGVQKIDKTDEKITIPRTKTDQEVCAVLMKDGKSDGKSHCKKVPKLEEPKKNPAGPAGGPFNPGMFGPGMMPSRTGGDVILRGVR